MGSKIFDAVIFDLDGVITQTATVHCKAWKTMFDEYLKKRCKKHEEVFTPFNKSDDYLKYVDGKPRFKGVESFLRARDITLPFGEPSDSPEKVTVCGLGNRKNKLFNELIKSDSVKVFYSTVKLIKELKQTGIKIGVCTSSKNCELILKTTNLYHFFDTHVDAVVSDELKLKGKPDPDIFIQACNNLGVYKDRAVIIEDAISGVQAGRNGNFGLVIGIAREENSEDLKINGADIVVKDLCEINIEIIENWFLNGLKRDRWSVKYHGYDENKEQVRESLCTVGNGYFGTRGALEEYNADGIHYPGTYISGLYNKLESKISEKSIVNEDMVNCPNWLPVTFRIGNDDWINIGNITIVSFKRILNIRNGILYKKIIIKDKSGRETLIESKRLASMENKHIAALRYNIIALNYSDYIHVKAGLDGNIENKGVKRYMECNSKHLEILDISGNGPKSKIKVRTNQSGIEITEISKLNIFLNYQKINPDIKRSIKQKAIYSEFSYKLIEGNILTVDKILLIRTSKDKDYNNFEENLLDKIESFEEVEKNSEKEWNNIWKEVDIKIEGDRLAQKLIRFNIYHLMISFSKHNIDIDSGFPARGLHGEAYRGHIFWVEMFILPVYNMHFPEVAKSILMYRYRRLSEARKNAKDNGYKGAMFPWQSGSKGCEETQVLHLNPVSGKWGPDYSPLQRHVSLAIAYNIWNYYHISDDISFLNDYGLEMILEICRFWAGISEYNTETGHYEIKNVMGPDEFHEQYNSEHNGGIKDNSYTNIMVVWLLNKAFEILDILDNAIINNVFIKIGFNELELDRWDDIRSKINIVISDNGILSQFDGYFNLKELDWEEYKEKYKNISRMDRILKAEGKSVDDYKIAKQADALMVFYNLKLNEIKKILNQLGYSVREDFLKVNFNYYYKRTAHGSTLSNIVHSYLANLLGNKEPGRELYDKALQSDYMDIQGGTTGEGIHTGVMAGSVLITLYSYIGLDLSKDIIHINPCLPESFRKVSFSLIFKKDTCSFEISNDIVTIFINSKKQTKIPVIINNKKYFIKTSQHEHISLK